MYVDTQLEPLSVFGLKAQKLALAGKSTFRKKTDHEDLPEGEEDTAAVEQPGLEEARTGLIGSYRKSQKIMNR